VGNGTCNATSCPDGCCNGNTCVPRASETNLQCGTGVGGAACTSCQGLSQCQLDAGACSTGGLGFDAGFGLPAFCDATTACPATQCCTAIGVCLPMGTTTVLGDICGPAAQCSLCFTTTCNLTTFTCN
jgi:hypothetical protein